MKYAVGYCAAFCCSQLVPSYLLYNIFILVSIGPKCLLSRDLFSEIFSLCCAVTVMTLSAVFQNV